MMNRAEQLAWMATELRNLSGECEELSEAESHNGWANYETWAVGLRIDFWGEAETCRDQGLTELGEIAQSLKEDGDEYTGYNRMDNDLARDLLGSALDRVDWYDLAEHVKGAMEDLDD